MPKPGSTHPPPAKPASPFADFFERELGHTPTSPNEEEKHEPAASTNASATDRLLNGQKATLSLDRKRRRGKTVTVVAGIHLPPRDFEDLARSLRQSCGAGGTISESNIEIQGDHRDRVEEYLGKLGVTVRRSGG